MKLYKEILIIISSLVLPVVISQVLAASATFNVSASIGHVAWGVTAQDLNFGENIDLSSPTTVASTDAGAASFAITGSPSRTFTLTIQNTGGSEISSIPLTGSSSHTATVDSFSFTGLTSPGVGSTDTSGDATVTMGATFTPGSGVVNGETFSGDMQVEVDTQ